MTDDKPADIIDIEEDDKKVKTDENDERSKFHNSVSDCRV